MLFVRTFSILFVYLLLLLNSPSSPVVRNPSATGRALRYRTWRLVARRLLLRLWRMKKPSISLWLNSIRPSPTLVLSQPQPRFAIVPCGTNVRCMQRKKAIGTTEEEDRVLGILKKREREARERER